MGDRRIQDERIEEALGLMERSLALARSRRSISQHLRGLPVLAGSTRRSSPAAGLDIAPNDLHCHHNLGVLYYHRLELDEAIASGERPGAQPDFAGAHFGIAEASLLRGDLARAGGI